MHHQLQQMLQKNIFQKNGNFKKIQNLNILICVLKQYKSIIEDIYHEKNILELFKKCIHFKPNYGEQLQVGKLEKFLVQSKYKSLFLLCKTQKKILLSELVRITFILF
eukprot:TRINITY_DN13974_c0_g1_i1.p3 TRINITY_DN13974_c0_g1~~TRINITY_DN13974_c0_g1_i1.p3  ORF type:complete len:108 (-),score=4.43 TRINITY_DN13974_c0_g1_i1:110-433(-)